MKRENILVGEALEIWEHFRNMIVAWDSSDFVNPGDKREVSEKLTVANQIAVVRKQPMGLGVIFWAEKVATALTPDGMPETTVELMQMYVRVTDILIE